MERVGIPAPTARTAEQRLSQFPYARAVTSELCRLADECLLSTLARQLAAWVGTRRPVTTNIGDTSAACSAFRHSVTPEDAGLELLVEIGAVDDEGRPTELGRWMLQRLIQEWPPPLALDTPAAAMLDRLTALPRRRNMAAGLAVAGRAWGRPCGGGAAHRSRRCPTGVANRRRRRRGWPGRNPRCPHGSRRQMYRRWLPTPGGRSSTSSTTATRSRRNLMRPTCAGSPSSTRPRRWRSTDRTKLSLSFTNAAGSMSRAAADTEKLDLPEPRSTDQVDG
jgi:hypothetical protein